MNHLKKKFSVAAQTLIAVSMVAILVVACKGGSTLGFVQTYSASAGAGEVLQFSVDTTTLIYSYTVIGSSYNQVGQTGTGLLTSNGNGTYGVGPSSPSFITSGTVFPIQNGFLVGHVEINSIGGQNNIPVFGISNPITTIAGLVGTYNFQGFGCVTPSGANVFGSHSCLAHYGTITIDTSGNYSICKGGDINTDPATNACVSTASGTIQLQTLTPGVFEYWNASNQHIGWFFAFTAPNNQKVAVIDHDDAYGGEYGHTVLATYASAVSGASDGNYFVENNERIEHLVTISGVNVTSTLHPGISGTLIYNSPWPGLTTYTFSAVSAVSGVAMTAGTGAYTHTDNADPKLFAVGLKY